MVEDTDPILWLEDNTNHGLGHLFEKLFQYCLLKQLLNELRYKPVAPSLMVLWPSAEG